MRAGRWRRNGDTIRFSTSGLLIDGQHRLAAVVDAGVSVDMLIVRGLDEDVQSTIDGGQRRSFSDQLKLRGEKNFVPLAATCKAVAEWETYGPRAVGARNFTNAQLFDVLERHPALRDVTAPAGRVYNHTGLPTRIGGLTYWLFSRIDSDDAEHFFDRMCSDQNHSAGEPIYELRKAIEGSTSARGARGARSVRYLLAITIKAWNKYRRGEEVWTLRFRTGGAKPEAFPIPE